MKVAFENCRHINNHGCEIYFCRHAEGNHNIGIGQIDAALSDRGIEQAKKVTGEYDMILCSPLRRTKETLHFSTLKSPRIHIVDSFRECIQSACSNLLLEEFKGETVPEFFYRADCVFQPILEKYCKEMSEVKPGAKILLIGHGYFFNAWFRRGCFPTPPNAEIIRMI